MSVYIVNINAPCVDPSYERVRVELAFPIPQLTRLKKFANLALGNPGFPLAEHEKIHWDYLNRIEDADPFMACALEMECATMNTTIERIFLLANPENTYTIYVGSRLDRDTTLEGMRVCMFKTSHVFEIGTDYIILELEAIPETAMTLPSQTALMKNVQIS